MTYTGAVGRTTFEQVARILRGGRHVLQPKVDGAYCEVRTGRDGAVRSVHTRTGARMGIGAHLIGAHLGVPHSVFAGEIEGYTESGQAMAAASGAARVHLFDALEVDGRDLSRDPYHARRDELMRAWATGADAFPVASAGRCAHAPGRDGSGRFAHRGPINWGLFPIVPQCRDLETAWANWVAQGYGRPNESGEGLVLVALDAPIGRRTAKRKLKPQETIDCIVLRANDKRAVLQYGATTFALGVGGRMLRGGEIVEVMHDGWYSAGAPRFPRIVRVRHDLAKYVTHTTMC